VTIYIECLHSGIGALDPTPILLPPHPRVTHPPPPHLLHLSSSPSDYGQPLACRGGRWMPSASPRRSRTTIAGSWSSRPIGRLIGTKLRMSMSYHPQTDGQTKRVNWSIKCFLRCLIHAYPSCWSKWLRLCEFW
jgi:hypothetical protein